MLNYFDLFELQQQYSIDTNKLTTCYLNKQKEIRSTKSNDITPVLLNTAYSTLKNPLQRTEYLLTLQGKNADKMPQKLAQKMFSLREQFENLSNSNRENFIKEQTEKIDTLLDELKDYSENSDTFFEIFCEAKFIHSFLEKVKNVDDRY